MSFLERLEAVRQAANASGLPVRRKDRTLYEVLASCATICEDALRERSVEDLRREIVKEGSGPKGKGAKRVREATDVYGLVCRYVFGDRKEFSSLSKYAQTLREAANRQIASEHLLEWLCKNGGARALYLTIKTPRQEASRKTLNLNQSIAFPKKGPFALTLEYDGKGFFNVIDAQQG